MNRAQLTEYIGETYNADEERPWAKFPNYAVFRRRENGKWFALVADVPKSKLGLAGGGSIDVLNVKCDPLLIGSLRRESGFFPAYHMSKESWITLALDGSVADEKIKWLLDESFAVVAPKARRRGE